MNKVGYIVSLVGGVLALVLAVLLIVTGPVLFAGDEVSRFAVENNDDLGKMWTDIGDYYKIEPLLKSDLNDYIDDYSHVLQNISAHDLESIGQKYNMDSFRDLAGIFNKYEGYLPRLEIGFIACIIASVIALIGAEIARRFRTAGGAMVLCSAALTLIFSLVASSIIPMAVASLLLILGGLLQIAKPKVHFAQEGKGIAGSGGGI